MKTIAIVAKRDNKQILKATNMVFKYLKSIDCEILFDVPFNEFQNIGKEEIQARADFCISIGGDGTVLYTSGNYQKPIISLNLGFLGFLAEFNIDNIIPSLNKILSGEYKIVERMNIEATAYSDTNEIIAEYHCLNDFVIKSPETSLIKLDMKINFKDICSYSADGLIISTPTGSTAYNLAAGGPIVHHSLSAIIISSICSHSLSDKPIVIPSQSIIKMELSGGEGVLLTDGVKSLKLKQHSYIIFTMSSKTSKLVSLGYNFYESISKKLHWGHR